jgi:hypothetical protein
MYVEAKSVVRDHYGSLPMRWPLKEPFSVRAREQGSALEGIARTYRLWSMRISQGAKVEEEEAFAAGAQLDALLFDARGSIHWRSRQE